LKSEKRAGMVAFSKEKVDDVYRVPYWNGRFIELTITNLRLICVCIPTSVNNMHNNSKRTRYALNCFECAFINAKRSQ
jgi:hypothetical protein